MTLNLEISITKLGTIIPRKKSDKTARLKRNSNRSRIYAVTDQRIILKNKLKARIKMVFLTAKIRYFESKTFL